MTGLPEALVVFFCRGLDWIKYFCHCNVNKLASHSLRFFVESVLAVEEQENVLK
jgi:hypothetical protein